MKTLTPGANATVIDDQLKVRVSASQAADVSSFRLSENGKVRADDDMVFYGQKVNGDQTVKLVKEGAITEFEIVLTKLQADVQKIAFSITVDNGTVSALNPLEISILWAGTEQLKCPVTSIGSEAALILGELYRRNAEWKFRFIAQGFNGGLQPLAEHFGVDIDDPAPAPPKTITPPPAPPSTPVNLSKITLDKSKPSVNLKKTSDGKFGLLKVNLNWNQQKKSGFMGFGKSQLDLDLGAFVEHQDGNKGVIQALGNAFGDIRQPPYVQLMGDDRSGGMSDGEWLHINGDRWSGFKRILVYAFIYEGAPNWSETDGMVTLHIPGQPKIETHLTEGSNHLGTCAVAEISNQNGEIKINRLDRYFASQVEMDKAFHWGFRWSAGSK